MSTPREFIDIGGHDELHASCHDGDPHWQRLRVATEEQAKDVRWWLGIWDDTEPPYGMTEAILLELSTQLHRDYIDCIHAGPLKSVAEDIVLTHVDAARRDGA